MLRVTFDDTLLVILTLSLTPFALVSYLASPSVNGDLAPSLAQRVHRPDASVFPSDVMDHPRVIERRRLTLSFHTYAYMDVKKISFE